MPKIKNKKENNKYDASNEIIIGVTTNKTQKKVRVDEKTTRTNNKKIKPKNNMKKNSKKKFLEIASLFLLLIGGTIYYLTSPVFNIKNIIIYGNNKIPDTTCVSLSQIEKDTTNIFAINKNKIEKYLKENPYVESITLKRKLPDTVEITVKERQEQYQFKLNNEYAYIDSLGYILEVNENINKNIILIQGTETKEILIGERLENEDLEKLNVVSKILNYFKYNRSDTVITLIDITDINNYTVKIDEEGKTIYLGDNSNLAEKLATVVEILDNEKQSKGEIFANEMLLKKNRIYFKSET